jgi:hypothetical protein
MIKDLRTFSGGIDFDTDDRAIANTDYKYGMCLATGVSDRGAVTNMLGSVKIDYTLPDGNNAVIGTLRNIKENSIIYFVFNDLLNHSILEYKCLDKLIEPILEPRPAIGFTTDFLGFTIESKIHSANILDNILTWTDNNVSPRKINKKRAKDFLNQLTPSADNIPYDNLLATGTFEEKIQFIELIKYKPSYVGRISTGYDNTRNTNFIINRMVQMKYRYIYDDNEISRWSDATTFTLPPGQENISGTISLRTNNNFVQCFVNTGHPTVKNIDVAFRFGDRGVWARLDEPIKKYNNSNQRLINDYQNYEVIFYNDRVLVEVADEFDNYDAIPLKAATQDIIDGNILVLANTEEGYENPEIDVVTTPYYGQFTIGTNSLYAGVQTPSLTQFTIATQQRGTSGFINTTAGPYFAPTRSALCIPFSNSIISPGTTLVFTVRRATTSPSASQDYDLQYLVTEDDMANWPFVFGENLLSRIRNASGILFSYIVVADGGSGGVYPSVPQFGGITMLVLTLMDTLSINPSEIVSIMSFNAIPPLKKERSLKKGSSPIFGIVYRDIQGRDGGVVTNDAMSLYVPYTPETNLAGTVVNQTLVDIIRPQFEVKHIPPIWAHNYQFVYGGNGLKKYSQFILKDATMTVLPNGNYMVNCDYIVDYITKERIQTSLDFQFEKGDRLRFIQNSQIYVSEYIECQVLDYDTASNNLTVSPFDLDIITNTMSPKSLNGTLVELFAYTDTVSSENRPYFSIGAKYDIVNPGTPTRRHAGNIRNQTSTQSALARPSWGDTFVFYRYFDKTNIARIVESENFSDFYPSNNIGISSIYAVIPNGKTKRYEQLIRHGGRYFQNTNVNNLCRFSSDDFDILNAMYGPINKVVTMGYTLKCLQTKKNTSIYIGRNMVFNANGSSQLSLTDKVFGDKNPSELDYGCANPESVCVDDRQMYFFDVNTGTIIQDSANGMMPISDYKARTHWRNIADTIKNIPGIYVYSGVDNFNKYVHFTIQDTNETRVIEDQTIVYHEDENRWKSFMPYKPEYYGSNAMVMVTFKDGELWEQNSVLVPRNNFFGQQYNSEIEFISNIEYPNVKVFNTIAVYANKVFYSPSVGDIKTIANGNYATGMISRLVKSKFRPKEGVFYADYLRDANTPNMPSQDVAIMEGRKLRGEFLLHKLINDDTDKVVLYSVIVGSVKSDKSG